MKYTVKQCGIRLDGKFGIQGEISGLTREDVISQIESLKKKWENAKSGKNTSNGLYEGNDMIVIFDEYGRQHTMKEFINETT